MDCTCIRYTQVPKTSPLVIDYLYHFDRVSQFYGYSPFNIESYRTVAQHLSGTSTRDRRELVEILTRQNEELGSGERTFANIAQLRDQGAFAVVTGQQVGLFSGPAFTIYKALTAVRLSEWLSSEGLPSVPVFWLATEDHDFEEVAATFSFGDEYDIAPLRDAGISPAPQASVGSVKLSQEIGAVLSALEATLPGSESRETLMQDLRRCYQPGVTWGRAFGRFLACLFSRRGVVLLDALDHSIHKLASPVYRRAFSAANDLRSKLQERSEDMIRAGYHAQVHVGDDSTLLFLNDGGNRVALRQRGDGFFVGDRKLTTADLEGGLNQAPLHFSPNALLRPLVQDTLLPTISYITGPSELAYHGQARVLYPEFGRPAPVLFPRAGFTLIDPRVRKLLDKYRLTVEDVWKGEEHLRVKIAATAFAPGWAERFDQAGQDCASILGRLRADVGKIDSTLLEPLGQAEEKIKYQLDRLRDKLSRAALERSELLARHERLLLRFLTPNKDIQERQITGAYFLGRAGYGFLDRILGQIQTRSSDHQVIQYSVEPFGN
jgi:bacillithiol biosynthesis cysteine-adding enzyme BshC